jgi:FkbM family methyltransferase
MAPDAIRYWLGRAPDVIVEIGCNDGTDTVKFLEAFPQAKMYCFEPDPRAATAFRENVKNHRAYLLQLAVSDECGVAQLWQSSGPTWKNRDWDLSSSICAPTRHLERSPEITFHNQVPVRTTTLDAWRAARKDWLPEAIDFIWCDPQGAQAKIIRGGKETLKRTRWLYIEAYDSPLYDGEPSLIEICEMLPDWELVGRYANENALFRNREIA